MAMIKRGQKITGTLAIAAAHLNLGELYRSENNDFALRVRKQTSAENERNQNDN